MYLDDVKKCVKAIADAKAPVSVLVWGKHGIGKTQIFEQLAEELGYGFRNLRLSQIDPVELIGFPQPTNFTIGTEEIKVLDYYPPKWYAQAMRGKFIIFLDELNRAKRDVLQAVFELVNERQLNGNKLPADVVIVCACNPPDSRYDTHEFDEALNDRFVHVLAESNVDVFLEWAKTKNREGKPKVSEDVTGFLAVNQEAFDKIEASDRELSSVVQLTPSPRSWARVDMIHNLNLEVRLKQQLIRGVVGNELAIQFMNHLNTEDRPFSLKEILEMNEKTQRRIKVYSEHSLKLDPNSKEKEAVIRTDILKASCQDIESDQNAEETAKNADKVLRFLEMIPANLAQTTLQTLIKRRKYANTWEKEILREETVDGKTVRVYEKLMSGLESMKKTRDEVTLNPLKR